MSWKTDFDNMVISKIIEIPSPETGDLITKIDGRPYFGCYIDGRIRATRSGAGDVHYGKVWRFENCFHSKFLNDIILLAYSDFEPYDHGFETPEDINKYTDSLPRLYGHRH